MKRTVTSPFTVPEHKQDQKELNITLLSISQSSFDIDRLVHCRDIGGVDCVRAWAELGCSDRGQQRQRWQSGGGEWWGERGEQDMCGCEGEREGEKEREKP